MKKNTQVCLRCCSFPSRWSRLTIMLVCRRDSTCPHWSVDPAYEDHPRLRHGRGLTSEAEIPRRQRATESTADSTSVRSFTGQDHGASKLAVLPANRLMRTQIVAGRDDSLVTPSALARRVTPDNPTVFRVATIPTGRFPTYATIPTRTAGVVDRRQSASAVRRSDPASSRVSRRERHQPCTMTTHRGTTAALETSTPLPVKNGGIATMTSEVSPMRTQQTTVAASKDNRDRFRAQALQPSSTLPLNMSEAGLDHVQ